MKKVLFITGSINQTSQMHQIAKALPDANCWFSQVFTDNKLVNMLIKHTGLADGTALAGQFRLNSEKYLCDNGLQIDYAARLNNYDLVVYCSDILIPRRMRAGKTIWVQEGMVDRFTWFSKLVKLLKLPPAFCGDTSLNGSTNRCDIYCAASAGYKQYFSKMGTNPEKIIITGMPNYDYLSQFLINDFPYRDYVMVATTDMRETFRVEDRPAFIRKAVEIADGRPLLFKLHPNENFERAISEIRKHAPEDTMIFTSGNTNQMIANCCELITQYSTVVFTGIVLGKKVYSWFDVEELKKLSPLQNEGTSALTIASICWSYLNHIGDKTEFNPQAALIEHGQNELVDQLLEEPVYGR